MVGCYFGWCLDLWEAVIMSELSTEDYEVVFPLFLDNQELWCLKCNQPNKLLPSRTEIAGSMKTITMEYQCPIHNLGDNQ